mmetsp:Transcript_26251/g.60369  ORF Transcript_26251/g.60369 Transcript_26251/m.60369 type:complete len:130 (-) Transcript_26251:2511-2900(-)
MLVVAHELTTTLLLKHVPGLFISTCTSHHQLYPTNSNVHCNNFYQNISRWCDEVQCRNCVLRHANTSFIIFQYELKYPYILVHTHLCTHIYLCAHITKKKLYKDIQFLSYTYKMLRYKYLIPCTWPESV